MEATMTPKDNLMAVLSGQRPEWMPACVHVSSSNNLPGFLPRALLKEPLDWLAISTFVGGDVLYETHGVQQRLADGFAVRTEAHGDSRRTTLDTPEGCLTQQMAYCRTASPAYADLPPDYALPEPLVTSAHTKHFVAGRPDYSILSTYFKAQTFTADCDSVALEKKRVGDSGVCVLAGGPSSPLYSLVSDYAGIEQLSYDLHDHAAVVESAMQSMQQAACRWYRAAAATPCDVIRCTEDLDTKLVSPDLFKRYALPALREYARICHANGKLFVVHMCGHIRDFLPALRDAGADAIHCLTRPPMGNTSLPEARSVLAGRTAAMIRFDADLLLHGTEAQIDGAVAEIREQVGDWRNVLVIMPCGRAPLRNIRRVIEQVRGTTRR
jgi:hypothetical protein